MRDLQENERQALAQLQRTKLFATLVLVLCFVTLIVTKILEAHFPWLAIVVAFAEAATIGGIADWYAVVALFKKPLNLPFPHTAIIPNNQHRIATNLGGFIESNFLARDQITSKLREVDFAGEIATWLSDRTRAQNLSGFLVRFAPQLLSAVDDRGLVTFASQRVTAQLSQTRIAPLVGDVMESFTKDGQHQKLLDEVLSALNRFLGDPETLAVIRTKVKAELPVLVSVFRGDVMVLNRIVQATAELLDEVQADPDHPLRDEFAEFLAHYIDNLRGSTEFAARVETLKSQLLARPEIGDLSQSIWDNLKRYVLEDVAREDSTLAARLADLFVDIGTRLKDEDALRADINTGMVHLLANLVEDQRSNISAYIADQVRGWDMRQLITLIEVNVGRDLQFIRFNGMLVGGAVGVCLYVIETLLLP